MVKIKKILVSQPRPAVIEKSPFFELAGKYGLTIEYLPLIKVVGVTLKEFRSQRVEILNHTAVIFTSRTTIDNFFRICEEARISIPETMKYYCNTEAVALYLQKYIVYRKRKIAFADGSFEGFMELLLKNKSEKMLLTLSEPHKPELPHTLEKLKFKFDKLILNRSVSADVSALNLSDYQLIVFYSPNEIKVVTEAFPEAQMPLIATFGEGTARAAIASGLTVNAMAPTPEAPSMSKALDIFIGKINKGEQVESISIEKDNKAENFVKAQQSKESRRRVIRKTSSSARQ